MTGSLGRTTGHPAGRAAAQNEHVARIRDAVLSGDKVRAVGGGSKGALSGGGTLSVAGMSGMLEYDPQEYTFTALAGTPIREVASLLAEHGQYLPFDPPFAESGATLGGTVAAGLSGPGRFRYGGVRDFILGATFVSGTGQLVTGGGKVVKNAAGFDFPKLLVGSLGQFGVMVELTFKVFPAPASYATLTLDAPDLTHACGLMQRLATSGFEPHGLELEPLAQAFRVRVRLGGIADALPGRLGRLQAFLGHPGEVVMGDADAALWRRAREFLWLPDGYALVKIALSPADLMGLEYTLVKLSAQLEQTLPRRYSVGGNVLYLAWPREGDTADRKLLGALLQRSALSGLALTGSWSQPRLGLQKGQVLMNRVLGVLDPQSKFSLEPIGGASYAA